MKASEGFQERIKDYLDKRAGEDSLFAEKYANKKKNISDCCTFIINQVRNKKVNAMASDEVYGLAVHYYDEEDIDPGKSSGGVKIVMPGKNTATGDSAGSPKKRQPRVKVQGAKVQKSEPKVKQATLF